ncbi:MAG: hypothetical protein V4438_02820 [Patescibacteria group bacterium]
MEAKIRTRAKAKAKPGTTSLPSFFELVATSQRHSCIKKLVVFPNWDDELQVFFFPEGEGRQLGCVIQKAFESIVEFERLLWLEACKLDLASSGRVYNVDVHAPQESFAKLYEESSKIQG